MRVKFYFNQSFCQIEARDPYTCIVFHINVRTFCFAVLSYIATIVIFQAILKIQWGNVMFSEVHT